MSSRLFHNLFTPALDFFKRFHVVSGLLQYLLSFHSEQRFDGIQIIYIINLPAGEQQYSVLYAYRFLLVY